MGSIETLYDQAGKARGYLARWRDEAGASQKKTFLLKHGLRKEDARQHVTKMERAKAVDENEGYDTKITVAALIEKYISLRESDLAEASIEAMRRRLRLHIATTPLGRMPARRVRWSHVQAWATRMRTGSSEATVEATLALVSSALNMAIRDQDIKPTYATHKIAIKDDAAEPTPFVPLEVEDVAAILAQMDPRRRIIAEVQAHTGARVQEVLGLLPPGAGEPIEIDLDAKVIRFREQLHRRRRVRIPMKTPQSRRDVVIGDVLVCLLRDYFAEHPTAGQSVAFTDAEGRPWGYDAYSGHLERAARRAGLSASTHDLRHHHASVLIRANVPLLAIARRLGHKGVRQVEVTYGHLLRAVDTVLRSAVDDAWGEARVAGDLDHGSDGVP
ncbi:tyrosine-type recombinase/integrase [Kineosporia sp. J2-2]|uniref:Tyrosine-type recombinase/integrase n=1 Tax=Kineosporia corallincola TaxID=2835133 RepID=A0ABS5TN76_9ACTN|nr:site-specific integrase [Kineosporia corallincola]MBT0771839.1 tyrosine-type recombinase/integrase [Kineosporia corallincola]